MNPSLVFIVLVLALTAYSEAYPGMRGNGASGAIRDRDPENPAFKTQRDHDPTNRSSKLSQATAEAKAEGDHPKTFTFTQEKGGSASAFSNASNNGGGPVSASSAAVGK